MDALLAVVLDALAPRREPRFELVADEILFGREPLAFLVFGRAVLRELGERQVRPHGHQRRREQLGLERLEPREVRTERHHAEVGLVTEHRHAHGLMPVGLERRDRIGDALAGFGIALGAITVDPVIEMQNAPTDRRRHRVHVCRGYETFVGEAGVRRSAEAPRRPPIPPQTLRARDLGRPAGACTCTGTPKS